MNKPELKRFFFIVGVGRSGTSLLMSMLNAHPEIILPPETHFFGNYVMRNPRISTADFKAKLLTDHRFARLGMSEEDISQVLAGMEGMFSPLVFYRAMLVHYSRQRDGWVIGDKAPKNVEYLPTIKRLFPDAMIIHIIRDPRDVYLSRTKAKWSSGYSDTAHYVACRSQYLLGSDLGPRLFGDRYYQMRYEDLLSDPEGQLQSVCRWLGVEFKEQMLMFAQSARELVSADEEQWKKETLGPLLGDNSGKWKRELSPSKIWAVEAACSPYFRDGYYRLSDNPKSVFQRLRSCCISVSIRSLSLLYRTWVRLKNLWTIQVYQKWSY